MDYYSVLGIKPSASADDIKRAYRQMVFRYHPDRNPNDAEAAGKFSQVRDAYAVLSDALKRRAYDGINYSNGAAETEPEEERAEKTARQSTRNDEEPRFTGNPFGATGGASSQQSYQQSAEVEPKCPSCAAAGMDYIVSRKGGSGGSRGKHFVLAPFNVVMCNRCGHVYGITNNSN